MEADAHALLKVLANGDSPTIGIDADEVPDQEIPRPGLLQKLVHNHAQEQRPHRELAVAVAHALEKLLDSGEGRAPVELVDHVSCAARDLHQLPYGPAALCHDGVH